MILFTGYRCKSCFYQRIAGYTKYWRNPGAASARSDLPALFKLLKSQNKCGHCGKNAPAIGS
ncbi:hypothetical protein CS542_01270 [Pedobacter sp. IW39]|nr:hypothetical protein CS542_01270 [Pedobacter sp. IW39]